ncbi:ketosynthase chain-length factor [Sciscionella marina]|uniref:ketosynthase chain-length factor n=1 Tax=Sciscionella marina TaxID=508770 RepID=UPI000374E6A2|nr:ketosynthase chain-length factor [Sciscionella marina]
MTAEVARAGSIARTPPTTRAVVTGIGILAPTGLGAEEHWAATLRGECAIRPLTRFDPSRYWARLAGEVRVFDPSAYLSGKLVTQTDRMTQMTLAATDWAFADSGAPPDNGDGYSRTVVTGATAGGYEFGQRELEKLWHQGPDFVSTYQSFAWFYAVNTGQISIRHGIRGSGAVVVSEQAGGLDAIGQARRQLRSGARLTVSGAIDSSLCPWAWVAHQACGTLSTRTDPATAYLPFDREVNGHVVGEGGAMLILEDDDSVRTRRTEAYGEIAGYAATFDSRDPAREPGLRRAAELAIDDAGLGPADIDVVFADAAGTATADSAEAAALATIFGRHGIPVTAPKTMTGRLYAGGGSLDVATALLAIRDQVIPPTVNVRDLPQEYGLDLVRDEPRAARLRAALVLARGRGGFNSAIVVTEFA